jgi:O-antigen/teichoic acid export membrane protein
MRLVQIAIQCLGRYSLITVAAGQAVSAIGSLILVKILTSALQVSEYGILALGFTGSWLINQFIFGPLNQTVIRFYSEVDQIDKMPEFLCIVRDLLAKASILVLTISIILSGFLLTFSPFYSWLIILISITSVVSGYSSILNGIQLARCARVNVATTQSVSAISRILLLILLVNFSNILNVEQVLSTLLIAEICILLLQVKIFTATTHIATSKFLHLNNDIRKRMWRYGLPFISWAIFSWLQFASDRWVLGMTHNSSTVGIYAAIFQLAYSPTLLLLTTIEQYFMPQIFLHASSLNDKTTQSLLENKQKVYLFVQISITFLVSLFFYLFHSKIALYLLPPEYYEFTYISPILACAAGANSLTQLLTVKQLSIFNSRGVLIPKILGTLFTIIIIVLSSLQFGIAGTACGVLMGAAVQAFLIWRFTKFDKS